MQSDELTPGGFERCPTCAAPLAVGAWFCGACGSLLGPLPPRAVSDATTPVQAIAGAGAANTDTALPAEAMSTDAVGADAVGADAAATPAAETAAPGGWQCAWCGGSNAAGVDRCVACGALLPRPERDAAFEREAEARRRALEGDREQPGEKRGWGRFFRPG